MLDDLLVCPVCHARLDGVRCTGCGRAYRAAGGGALDLTPVPSPDARVRERWRLWEQLQANGERAYEADPPSSLSVGERADADAFAAFCDLRGVVLDVGCGPQPMPSYARGVSGRLVGIDPLAGAPQRDFDFVQGVAEHLPFPDETFDRVLFATSLDHMLVPELALSEARRVLKAGGRACVWIGVLPKPSLLERLRRRLRPPTTMEVPTPQATLSFEIPEGAVDAFHVAHPDAAMVTRWLQDAGLAVEAVERPMPRHCFIGATRG